MSDLKSIEKEIRDINSVLKDRYNKFFSMNDFQYREDILKKIGKVRKLRKLSKDELASSGILVGVDGSTNRVGGAYPHYIELFQALAKPTIGEDLYLNECYTPMTGSASSESEERENKKKEKMLAQIELDVAIESIKVQNPSILMMDGGLIRYKINDSDRYRELVEICQENNVILVGVIKDLKTNIVSRLLGEDESIFDRELLYGRIKKGETIEIHDAYNNKFVEGLVSSFLNTSTSSMPIGIDLLESQRHNMEYISNLVYTITPENSRGVPLWLDIVDSEVKITDSLIKAMLEEYLDRDIYERFFISERDRRSL